MRDQYQISYICTYPAVYPGLPQIFKMENLATIVIGQKLNTVNHCCKVLHLRCLQEPWIQFHVTQKIDQTVNGLNPSRQTEQQMNILNVMICLLKVIKKLTKTVSTLSNYFHARVYKWLWCMKIVQKLENAWPICENRILQ